MSINLKYFFTIKERFNRFILMHPALLPLWALVLSISIYFRCLECVLVLAFCLVWVDLRKILTHILPLSLALCALFYFWMGDLGFKGELKGRAHLHVHELNLSKSAFGTSWVLKGFIKEFRAENHPKIRHLPFTLYIPKGVTLPKIEQDFWVEGLLKKSDFYGYSLKIKKGTEFIVIKKSKSLAQKRHDLKKKFGRFVGKKVPFKNAKTLLIGMSTGDFSDPILSFTFSRFGLNHLLAISGFHFAILALFLNFFLRIFPLKVRLMALGVLLTLFYFFVGYSPSLQRAWIVFLVYLLGTYKERMLTSVNVLSLSMILVLLLNPFMLFNLGFQFSFAITFALLLFYQPILKLLFKGVQKRSKVDEVLLKMVALGLAVHLTALPLSLYHFHKFYLMGFIFNLWVPAFISVFLFAFMSFLILFPLMGSFSEQGLWLVGYCLEKLLDFIYWVPSSFDYSIRTPSFPPWALILYLFLFFLMSSSFQKKKRPFFVKYIE